MPQTNNIHFLLSGGAANTVPSASLGGAKSTTDILSNNIVFTPSWDGVTVDKVFSETIGKGLLALEKRHSDSIWARWKEPGSDSYGSYVSIVDGTNVIEAAGPSRGFIEVTAVKASMTIPPENELVYHDGDITLVAQNLFNDVDSTEATNGSVTYRCLFIQHTENQTVDKVSAWVEKEYDSVVSIELAFDTVAVSTNALTLADETDSTNVLSGLTFSSALGKANAVETPDITMAQNDYVALWVKRTVPAGVEQAVADDFSTILVGTRVS